jgi:glycosyltransferase involved in cell wall biosynthesis
MAARTPVIASDVGACREVLADGRAGRLVPPHDTDALAAAIAELLTSPQDARALADQGHAHAEQHLDAAACAERYYTSLIPEWRRAAP